MKKTVKYIIFGIVFLIGAYFLFFFTTEVNTNPQKKIGEPLDSLNGVVVYYNGGVREVEGKDSSENNYLGLKYQCVEFVNRYYFQFYHHRMPDPYGNAIAYFDTSVQDGELNHKTNLIQFLNPGKAKPATGDIIIFDKGPGNKYGHIAIISGADEKEIEIIQQNSGAYGNTRAKFSVENKGDTLYYIKSKNVLGRLRLH